MASGSVVHWLIAMAIVGVGAYMLASGRGLVTPVFIIGIGLSFAPVRLIGVVGGLACLGAGIYWLSLNGQQGILLGGLFALTGVVILVERLRPRAG